MQLFIFNAGKIEGQYYTSMKKAFEFLNGCCVWGIIIYSYSDYFVFPFQAEGGD